MRAWYMAVLVTAVAFPLRAQSCHDKRYEAQEPTAALYDASPFLHGWRDGYEQGFHDADIEQQFAHPMDTAKEEPHYRKVEYHSEFGQKSSYVGGYRAGFVQGFADMRAGQDFRAFHILKQAAAAESEDAPRGRDFDTGVAQGFSGDVKACEKDAVNDYCRGARVGAMLAKTRQ